MNVDEFIKLVPDIDPNLEDWMEKRVQSMNKANVDIIIEQLGKQNSEAQEAREEFRTNLLSDVKKEITVTVNGKLDKANTAIIDMRVIVDGHDKDIKDIKDSLLCVLKGQDEMKCLMEPIIAKNKKHQVVLEAMGIMWGGGKKGAMAVAVVSACIAGLIVIKPHFVSLVKYLFT